MFVYQHFIRRLWNVEWLGVMELLVLIIQCIEYLIVILDKIILIIKLVKK